MNTSGALLSVSLTAHPSSARVALSRTCCTSPAIDRAHLAALGLTRRECEMIQWLRKGKRDREIGTILGLSPRTIEKQGRSYFYEVKRGNAHGRSQLLLLSSYPPRKQRITFNCDARDTLRDPNPTAAEPPRTPQPKGLIEEASSHSAFIDAPSSTYECALT